LALVSNFERDDLGRQVIPPGSGVRYFIQRVKPASEMPPVSDATRTLMTQAVEQLRRAGVPPIKSGKYIVSLGDEDGTAYEVDS
jgi:hypothetical protein